MMSEKNNCINVIVDGIYKSCYLEKIVFGHDEECDLDIIKLKAVIGDTEYITKRSFEMEFAVINLQRILPGNAQIACCQSCRHGNYCPLGTNENEIFCLMNYNPENKNDVIDIMTSIEDDLLPKHELLYWCDKYDKINKNYYVYNDWNYHFRQ